MYENTEELLFGGADNPSPLLEIVEQELAWRAEGQVEVYIQDAKDINSLRNTIKVGENSVLKCEVLDEKILRNHFCVVLYIQFSFNCFVITVCDADQII